MFKSIIGNFNRIIEELLKNSLNKNELALLGPISQLQSNSFIPDLKKLVEDSILWIPTPKKRMSAEKKFTRKLNENPSSGVNKYAKVKTNLIACLECGSYHEIGRICGSCYEKVKEETKKMMANLNLSKTDGIVPAKEVAYFYNNEKPNEEEVKDKFIVEIPDDRPKWFNNNLYSKVTTKK